MSAVLNESGASLALPDNDTVAMRERIGNDSGAMQERCESDAGAIAERSANDTVTIPVTNGCDIVCENDTEGNDKAASPAPGAIKLSALQKRLISRLEQLPDSVRLTPLNDNKQPQGKDWPNRPFCPTQMIEAVRNGVLVSFENRSGELYQKRIFPKGFGLLTGPISGGILAVDFDGASALVKFIELNGSEPALTEGFTSRHEWDGEYPDHFQLTFSVPSEYWGNMKNKVAIPTKWETDPNTGTKKVTERLELRWTNMQSCLPPSVHPETGSYRDLPNRAFGQVERAIAPDWIIEQLLIDQVETEESTLVDDNDTCTSPRTVSCTSSDSDGNVLDFRDVSHRLPHWNERGRNGWGTFQCPVHVSGSGHSIDHIHVNLATGKWEAHCECDPKEVYREVCRLVGFVSPKPQRIPTFLMTNDATLYPAAGQDKEEAMAYLAIPGNEAKVRARIAARNGKGNGNGNDNGNNSNNNGNGSGSKKGNDSGGRKPPPADVLGDIIADTLGERFRYCEEELQWYFFNGTVWKPKRELFIDRWVFTNCRERGINPLPSINYCENVRKILQYRLTVETWEEWNRSEFIPFRNGILEIASGKLIPHTPDSGFTSFLPFVYNPLTEPVTDLIDALKRFCPNIYEFFHRATNGNKKRILKLIATITGTMKQKFHSLQLFTHIMGKPATGKNMFTNVLSKIVGDENRAHSEPKALDRPEELAAILNKSLVVCPDVRKEVVNVQAFLTLTGGTPIRFRNLYKDRGERKFFGHLVVVSNTPIFTGDTTGIDRRLNIIEFENPIPKELRDGNAEKALDQEIPNLIQIALAMPDKEVSDLLKGVGSGIIPEYDALAWERVCESDKAASWLNEFVVIDPKGSVLIGDGKKTPENEFKKGTVYGSFLDYCAAEGGGRNELLRKAFTQRLHKHFDTLGSIASGVEKKKTRSGYAWLGIRLRSPESDSSVPFIGDLIRQAAEQKVREEESRSVGTRSNSPSQCSNSPLMLSNDGVSSVPANRSNSPQFCSNSPPILSNDGVSSVPANRSNSPDSVPILRNDRPVSDAAKISSETTKTFQLSETEPTSGSNPTSRLGGSDIKEEKIGAKLVKETAQSALPNDYTELEHNWNELEQTPERLQIGKSGELERSEGELERSAELEPPQPEPTLAELKAMLLACESLTDRDELKSRYGADKLTEAYAAMTLDEQIVVDGLTIREFPASMAIYKAMEASPVLYSEQDGHYLCVGKGELAIIERKDSCLAYVKKLGTFWKGTVMINPKNLLEVPRR